MTDPGLTKYTCNLEAPKDKCSAGQISVTCQEMEQWHHMHFPFWIIQLWWRFWFPQLVLLSMWGQSWLICSSMTWMKGQMPPQKGHWSHKAQRSSGLIVPSSVQTFRRIWAGWKSRQMWTTWNQIKARSGSCTWGRVAPAGGSLMESTSAKKDLGNLVDSKLHQCFEQKIQLNKGN